MGNVALVGVPAPFVGDVEAASTSCHARPGGGEAGSAGGVRLLQFFFLKMIRARGQGWQTASEIFSIFFFPVTPQQMRNVTPQLQQGESWRGYIFKEPRLLAPPV